MQQARALTTVSGRHCKICRSDQALDDTVTLLMGRTQSMHPAPESVRYRDTRIFGFGLWQIHIDGVDITPTGVAQNKGRTIRRRTAPPSVDTG